MYTPCATASRSAQRAASPSGAFQKPSNFRHDIVVQAISSTERLFADLQRDAEEQRRLAREAEDAAWRKSFRPQAVIQTEHTVPIQITICGLMGRLIAGQSASSFCGDRMPSAGSRMPGSGSSSQSALGRCTMGLRGRTSQGGRRTPLDSGAPHQAGWSGPRPGRDGPVAFAGERDLLVRSSGHAGGPVKQLARPQHRVHHDRELSGDGDGGTLEADPFLELEPPCPERALS